MSYSQYDGKSCCGDGDLRSDQDLCLVDRLSSSLLRLLEPKALCMGLWPLCCAMIGWWLERALLGDVGTEPRLYWLSRPPMCAASILSRSQSPNME